MSPEVVKRNFVRNFSNRGSKYRTDNEVRLELITYVEVSLWTMTELGLVPIGSDLIKPVLQVSMGQVWLVVGPYKNDNLICLTIFDKTVTIDTVKTPLPVNMHDKQALQLTKLITSIIAQEMAQ